MKIEEHYTSVKRTFSFDLSTQTNSHVPWRLQY